MTTAAFPPGFIVTHAFVTVCAACLMAALTLWLQRSRGWYFMLIALWIPGTVIACWLPSLIMTPKLFPSEPIPVLTSIVQGFFISPTLSIPLMGALINAPPGLSRTAQALGADRSRRLALVWLPLLRQRMVLGGVAIVILSIIMTFSLVWRLPVFI